MATKQAYKQWHGEARAICRSNNSISIARFCGYSAGNAPMEPTTKFGRYALTEAVAPDFQFNLRAKLRKQVTAKIKRARESFDRRTAERAGMVEVGCSYLLNTVPAPADPNEVKASLLAEYRKDLRSRRGCGMACLRMIESAIAMDVAGRNAVQAWRDAA